VVTATDLAGITVFSGLDDETLERLCRACADLTLAAGEYAAEEGDGGALFALLEGRIEAVKSEDGVERVVGRRDPGDIFGEVPITLGTVFPVGFRAAEASRIVRISPRDYHTLAVEAPAVLREVARLATHRMTGPAGLQGLAADPAPPRAVIAGEKWDPTTTELRRFLDRNQVKFEWVIPGEGDAAERWGAVLPEAGKLPAINVLGSQILIRPPLRLVAEVLGLGTEPQLEEYDVVIVGAGPAGLAAAVYGASEGLRTIVIEREAPGGQAGTSSRIENYLGFPSGVSGDELARRALQQARRLGAEILVTREITRLDAPSKELELNGGDLLRGRTVVLASGVTWRQLDIEGFDRLTGRGISYGAARSEAPATHGQDVHIVGAGNSAGQAAMFFSAHARSVTIVCRGDALEKSMSDYLIRQLATRPNIRVELRSQVVAAHGDTSLEAIDIRRAAGAVQREGSGGLYIFIGADAETGWLPPEIELDRRGYVLTGVDVPRDGWPLGRDPLLLETSVPGIFACGDVRSSPVKRVAAAVGEGSMAIALVHQYLRDPAPASA
jgi:thioredoxin reductase (NADPH)